MNKQIKKYLNSGQQVEITPHGSSSLCLLRQHLGIIMIKISILSGVQKMTFQSIRRGPALKNLKQNVETVLLVGTEEEHIEKRV